MGDLNVELYGHHIGRLVGTDPRAFDFQPDSRAFDAFDLGSTVLSEAAPLVPKPNRAHAERRRNFFNELLPEGDMLDQLAASRRLLRTDTIGLLRAYGRDVAGAIQIYDPSIPGEPRTPYLEPASERIIGDTLLSVQDAPLGNFGTGGKTSLNGVQNKIVLARADGQWHFARDGSPSTHILKPEVKPDGFGAETMIYDEEYGDRIARRLGLLEYDAKIEEFTSVPALVLERYDRSPDAPDGRIHQEDLCQALAVPRGGKYQRYGGAMTMRRVADLIARKNRGGLESLAKLLTLSVAVGNLDLHGKNISLLRPYRGEATLAPAYDVVPLAHQRNDKEMAMAVNDVYLHAHITAADIEAEVQSWRTRKAIAPIVRETILEIQQVLREEEPHPRAYRYLRDELQKFTDNLLRGRPTGDPAAKVIGTGAAKPDQTHDHPDANEHKRS